MVQINTNENILKKLINHHDYVNIHTDERICRWTRFKIGNAVADHEQLGIIVFFF